MEISQRKTILHRLIATPDTVFEYAGDKATIYIDRVRPVIERLLASDNFEDFRMCDPKKEICIYWNIYDVQSLRPDLTEEQAKKVLNRALETHDAGWGINWDILEDIARCLYNRTGEQPD